MVTNIESTDLDFEAIRSRLKTYLAATDEFSDYNFEGSALANILDVLAYNTHFNALTANMAINESFLETAQLRSSVVTHALSLGYFPRSKSASRATLNLSLNASSYVGDAPDTITLPAGTKFTGTIDGVSYTFQTRQSYTGTNNGFGVYTFADDTGSEDILIYEGEEITRTFLVPSASDKRIYVIADENMDTDMVDVRVFENTSTSIFSFYENVQNAIRITNTSRYYILKEAPNGYYELQFGEETLGLSPTTGNKITVTYLSVSGSEANGARSFVPQSNVSIDGQSFPLTVVAVTNSIAGAEKQSIESVRVNAPLNYASQKRMVTKNDYQTLIQTTYPTLVDVAAWGGEENIPVDYGKIYISLEYPDSFDSAEKQAIEDGIRTDLITPLSTMSIRPEFVDPIDLYIELICRYDFNPNLTSLTSQATSNRIITEIQNYFSENLNVFEGIFRRSNLLSRIDDINESILSTAMEVRANRRFTPNLASRRSYDIYFPMELSAPDDKNYVITSSKFVFNSTVCSIQNLLNSNTLQIVNESGTVIQRNIGSYTASSGLVRIDDFLPSSILSGNDYIKISALPANPATIRPLRNYILKLDEDETIAVATIDYQNQRTTL